MMSCKGNLALRPHGLWRACVNTSEVTSVVSHGPQPTRLLCPWTLQARILEWVAISSSKGSSWPRDGTRVSYIAGRFLSTGAREAPGGLSCVHKWSQLPKRAYSHPQTSSRENSPWLSSFIICYRIRVDTKSQTTNKKVSLIKHTTVPDWKTMHTSYPPWTDTHMWATRGHLLQLWTFILRTQPLWG